MLDDTKCLKKNEVRRGTGNVRVTGMRGVLVLYRMGRKGFTEVTLENLAM